MDESEQWWTAEDAREAIEAEWASVGIPSDFTDDDVLELYEVLTERGGLPDRDGGYDFEEALSRVKMPPPRFQRSPRYRPGRDVEDGRPTDIPRERPVHYVPGGDVYERERRRVMQYRLEELVELTGGSVVYGMTSADAEWKAWWDGLTDVERDAWLRDPDSFTVLTPSAQAAAKEQEAAVTEAVKHVRPLSAYFDAKKNAAGQITSQVFAPPRLAADIASDLLIVRGPGGGLWCDAGGVYRPGAEDLVADIVRRVLGSEFRANRLNEVMAWCKTLPIDITTDPPPENLLNVANGVLELDTLTLREVRDDERFTYQIPVPWVPEARCPQIEAFAREVVPADCVSLVVEIIGMCLLPTSRYRRAVMLLGPGSNGKSVLLRVVKSLLGAENISSVTLQALSEERFAKAQLFGKLANIAGDLDSKPVERSGSFKTLTGEDTITADHKYGQPFQFVNFATLVFSANEWPVSHDQTDAYFTRWVAIPFNQRYREDGGHLKPGEKRADPKLGDRLVTAEELQGLLVRAVAGARRLQERGGFAIPQSVRDALAEYRQWADTVMAWIEDAVSPKPDSVVTRKAVYARYREWCRDNGRSAVSTKKFWPRFREVLADQGVVYEEAKNAQDERAVLGVSVAGTAF